MNGWYYDEQIYDPLTSITLHPNQKLFKGDNGQIQWVDISPSEEDDEKYIKESGTGCGYSLVPIARSILNEDFNVAIANRWSPMEGDDIISNIWNTGRTIAPYTPIIREALGIADDKLTEFTPNPENKATTKIKDILRLVVNGAQNGLNAIEKHLNDNLVTQGTRFTYYSGSGTAFGNLSMRFTLFPEFVYINGMNSNKTLYSPGGTTGYSVIYKSVQDQVADLLPYINGTYETNDSLEIVRLALHSALRLKGNLNKAAEEKLDREFNEHVAKIKNERAQQNIGKIGNKVLTSISNFNAWVQKQADEFVSVADDVMDEIEKRKLIGWQHPPGGYKPFYRDIDAALQGTLKLKIGGQYTISSLLCQDASFNFSKILVKNIGHNYGLSPLYCDVTLNFTPATKFANDSLENFIRGNLLGLKGSIKTNEAGTVSAKEDNTGTNASGVQAFRVDDRLAREIKNMKAKYPDAQAGKERATIALSQAPRTLAEIAEVEEPASLDKEIDALKKKQDKTARDMLKIEKYYTLQKKLG